jgi:phospholipid/cholesterol/gamma-HCH transport system ATP-binding protein
MNEGNLAAGAPRDVAPAGVEIEVRGLHKAFDDHEVLRGIDLTVQRRDLIAIVGGSGCGKTVLLNHILGQLAPDAGSVRVADHDAPGNPLVALSELSEDELEHIHMHWGVVFQRNALFSGTVYDNIALWLSEIRNLADDAITVIARSVLEAVHLPSDDDFLALDVAGLSGGMAKRLAVARALAMDPLVMFYDEPTTGLDPTSAAQIHELIDATHFAPELAERGRTTVIITHDKDLLSRLRPRTVMLHDGRVHLDGPLEAFENSDSPLVRPYFELMPVLHQRPMPV